MKGSLPEPPPKPAGVIVPDALIERIEHIKKNNLIRGDFDALITLVRERDTFGRAKYGQPLMSSDGRNGIEDARQELGDLLQYVMKCKLAGDNVTPLLELITFASILMQFI